MPIKPTDVYLPIFLLKLNTNPLSPHATFHRAVLEMMAMMLKDADVLPTLLVAGPTAVTGTGKLT